MQKSQRMDADDQSSDVLRHSKLLAKAVMLLCCASVGFVSKSKLPLDFWHASNCACRQMCVFRSRFFVRPVGPMILNVRSEGAAFVLERILESGVR